MGLCANPNDPHPVGPVLTCHLQAYPSGLWMLLLLAKPTSQEHISFSDNLWQENVKASLSAFQAGN